MRKKVIGILIVGLLMLTVIPSVNASSQVTEEKENSIVFESTLLGVGFVRIHEYNHRLKGFVLFGINDGEVISTEFINIEFIEVDMVFAGYCTPFIFFFRYNPV